MDLQPVTSYAKRFVFYRERLNDFVRFTAKTLFVEFVCSLLLSFLLHSLFLFPVSMLGLFLGTILFFFSVQKIGAPSITIETALFELFSQVEASKLLNSAAMLHLMLILTAQFIAAFAGLWCAETYAEAVSVHLQAATQPDVLYNPRWRTRPISVLDGDLAGRLDIGFLLGIFLEFFQFISIYQPYGRSIAFGIGNAGFLPAFRQPPLSFWLASITYYAIFTDAIGVVNLSGNRVMCLLLSKVAAFLLALTAESIVSFAKISQETFVPTTSPAKED